MAAPLAAVPAVRAVLAARAVQVNIQALIGRGGPRERANGLDNPPLTAYHAAFFAFSHPDEQVLALCAHLHGLRVINDLPRQKLHQFLRVNLRAAALLVCAVSAVMLHLCSVARGGPLQAAAFT